MKKVTAKLIALALSIAMLVSILSACDLISVNKDRDMSQVVATVQIEDSVDPVNIYKRELHAGYISYGYQYVTNYGYSVSDAYQVVLDNLVSNEILTQQARIVLAKELKITPNAPITEFLSDYEIAEANYTLKENVNSLIESYMDIDEEDEETEDETYTERTSPVKEDEELEADDVPTDYDYKAANVILKKDDWATLKTEYPTVEKLDMAVFGAYSIDVSGRARTTGLNKLIKFLKANGLALEDENPTDVTKYSYFVDMLDTLYNNALVSNYEDYLTEASEEKLTNEGLWDEYKREYESQETLYKSDVSAYNQALESVSDTSFVLCNQYEGYGYTYSILIGFSDVQKEQLTKYNAETGRTQDEIIAKRKDVAKNIVAKDQRETWVYASRGTYDKTNSSFTFKEDYRTGSFDKLDNFIGTIIPNNADGVEKEDVNGVKETTWSFKNVIADEIPFETFFTDYVTASIPELTLVYFDENDVQNTVGKIANIDEEFKDKFDDLAFAFSTDPGSLSTYYGYAYSPIKSDYVEEFTNAQKAVVEAGVGAYTVVLTEFGYHIVVCSKLVEANGNYIIKEDAGKASFIADLETEGTLAYNYRQTKLDAVMSSDIQKVSAEIVEKYIDNDASVTYFKNAYKDLITEE